MKTILPLLFLTLIASTTTAPGQQLYWAIFGPIDVSTMSAMSPSEVLPAVTAGIHLKASSGDCYLLTVAPNGTLGTKYEACPK